MNGIPAELLKAKNIVVISKFGELQDKIWSKNSVPED